MLNLEPIEALLWTLLFFAPPLAFGAWLNRRGMLRARHLVYRYIPFVLTVSTFVYCTRAEIASTWWARLLLSIFSAVSITASVFVVYRIADVDVDELDQKWKKKKPKQMEKGSKVKRKRKRKDRR